MVYVCVCVHAITSTIFTFTEKASISTRQLQTITIYNVPSVPLQQATMILKVIYQSFQHCFPMCLWRTLDK